MNVVKIDQLIRSRRRSVALIVAADATLVVRAPHHLNLKVIEEFIFKKRHWIEKKKEQILSDGGPAHVEIVRLLKDAGADISIKDNEGVTALDHAKKRGFTEIADVLEDK